MVSSLTIVGCGSDSSSGNSAANTEQDTKPVVTKPVVTKPGSTSTGSTSTSTTKTDGKKTDNSKDEKKSPEKVDNRPSEDTSVSEDVTPTPSAKPSLKRETLDGYGIARLGILKGAKVYVTNPNDRDVMHDEDIVTDENGEFSLGGLELKDDHYYHVEVEGGFDVDPNGDGKKTEDPVQNYTTLTTIATGKQIKEGVSVNVLTDVIARRLAVLTDFNSSHSIAKELDHAAHDLIEKDLNGDGIIDYYDLLYLDTAKAEHLDSLSFDYEELYKDEGDGSAIIDLYYDDDPKLSDEMAEVFSEILSKIDLKKEDEAPYAALRYSVNGPGTLNVEGLKDTITGGPLILNKDYRSFSQAYVKLSNPHADKTTDPNVLKDKKIKLTATAEAGSSLIGWEGCEQDANDPNVCYAQPDKTKSVAALFKSPEKINPFVALVKVVTKPGEVGLTVHGKKAVLTVPENHELAKKVDDAIKLVDTTDKQVVVFQGNLIKHALMAAPEGLKKSVVKGIARYTFTYKNLQEPDVFSQVTVHKNDAKLNVDSIESLKVGDGTTIKPNNVANQEDVKGANPVDPLISNQLCGADKRQVFLYNEDVACVDKNASALDYKEIEGSDDVEVDCDKTVVESLDGDLYCVAQSDVHAAKKTKALSAAIRQTAAYKSGELLQAMHQQKLNNLTKSVTSQAINVDNLKVGNVVWIAGKGKAIYMNNGVFMVDKANGDGVEMINITDGDIKIVDSADRAAKAFQSCSNNLYAPECQFVDQSGLEEARKLNLSNGAALQAKLLPSDLVVTLPSKYDWLEVRFKTNAEINFKQNTHFDYGLGIRWTTKWFIPTPSFNPYVHFASRGEFSIKPFLSTRITAKGEKKYEDKANACKEGLCEQKESDEEPDEGDVKKEVASVNLAHLANAGSVLSAKLEVGIGVSASGEAQIELIADYRQLIKWDVRKEMGSRGNRNWFKMNARGYPGATLKGRLSAEIGAYAYAGLYLGPSIMDKLIQLEAKYYFVKIEGLGRFIVSAQTDPDAIVKQNGQALCWGGELSIKGSRGDIGELKIKTESSNKILDKVIGLIGRYEYKKKLWDNTKTMFEWKKSNITDEDEGYDKLSKEPSVSPRMDLPKGVTFGFGEESSKLDEIKCPSPKPEAQKTIWVFAKGSKFESGTSYFTKKHELTMQPDGNLVVYKWSGKNNNGNRDGAIWASNTSNNNSYADLKFTQSGNLVMHNFFGEVVWQSNTAYTGGEYLVLKEDGELQIVNKSSDVIWSSKTGGKSFPDEINISTSNGDRYLRSSYAPILTKKLALIMQKDGNLVLYNRVNSKPIWASGTNGKGKDNYAVFQRDGNLVIYDRNRTPIWSSGTYNKGVDTYKFQNDGNFVIYRQGGRAVWASNTRA